MSISGSKCTWTWASLRGLCYSLVNSEKSVPLAAWSSNTSGKFAYCASLRKPAYSCISWHNYHRSFKKNTKTFNMTIPPQCFSTEKTHTDNHFRTGTLPNSLPFSNNLLHYFLLVNVIYVGILCGDFYPQGHTEREGFGFQNPNTTGLVKSFQFYHY